MLKIYINNILQKTEILPVNIPTKDETLETFSFALMANTNPLPLAPMQRVKVDFKGDGTEVKEFYIVSDSVETCCLKPLLYKHSISCIQNTRSISKVLVRNSVFTQPANPIKHSHNAHYMEGYFETGNPNIQLWKKDVFEPSLNWSSKKLTLNEKEHIRNVKVVSKFQYSVNQVVYSDATSKEDILSRATSYDASIFAIVNQCILKYIDSNNQQVETQVGFNFLNAENNQVANLIKNLSNNGCNNFELMFVSNSYSYGDNVLIYNTATPNGNHDNIIDFYICQIEIIAETYYWTCYDILDLLIKRQKLENLLNSNAPLFGLPTSGELYNLLKNTPAPNFTFTDLTMYECVAEVFRVFDAIFTFEWDQAREIDVLGIEYFNDLESDELPENTKFTGRTLALGEDKFTNGLVANYQDARIEESFPNNGGFAHLRSSEFGVPNAQDHGLIVPHNIQSIIKCEVLVNKIYLGPDHTRGYDCNLAVDVTDYVFEKSIWSLLDVGGSSTSNRLKTKGNTAFFTEGDNKIDVAYVQQGFYGFTYYSLFEMVRCALLDMFGFDADSGLQPDDGVFNGIWHSVKMRATYIASVDGKTKVHSLVNKYPGETIIDQANGAVDLNKFGLNMLGLSLKLGNPTLNATHKITNWDNRIRTGQLYNWQGKLWVANTVNYTFIGNGILQGKVSFVQNFNALSLRTQLLREKRMSNISRELIQKSEPILTDFAYYSTESIIGDGSPLHFNYSRFIEFVTASFNIVGPYPSIKDAYIYDPTKFSITEDKIATYIPLIKYGAGNTINFEMSYEHPMNAGNQTKHDSNGYFTNHVIYTDESGFLDTVSIVTPLGEIEYTDEFPKVNIGNPGVECYYSISRLKIFKQPNEIFALNYQIAFLPIPGRENIDFLGAEFINNNAFVKTIMETTNERYITFMAHKSSNLDVKATNYFEKKTVSSVVSTILSNYKFRVDFIFDNLTQEQYDSIVSWAVVDKNDNILFASNYKQPYGTNVSIYFFTRPTRLN